MPGSSPPNKAAETPRPEGNAGPGNALRLDKPGRVFRMTGGGADVFALGLDGAAKAMRLPMFRVEDGGCLVGLGVAAGICLIAVPVAGARIETVEAAGAMDAGALAVGIDGWVTQVVDAVTIAQPPQVTAIAETGLWSLTPGRAVRPASGVVWLNAVSGEAGVFGSIPVPAAIATPLPVTPNGFVTAADPASLNARSTEAQLASGNGSVDLAALFGALGETLLPLISRQLLAAEQELHAPPCRTSGRRPHALAPRATPSRPGARRRRTDHPGQPMGR